MSTPLSKMLLTSFLLLAGAQSVLAKCKCTPTDDCWPSPSKWSALNASVDGQLIYNQPIAKPCYPGPGYDAQLCQEISKDWTESPFKELSPMGYTYPLVDTCPPINASVAAYPLCELGNAPVYTINATKAGDVAAGIKFAMENNVRLVIKDTGYDIVGRSQGYGSLIIWVKYIRDGLDYQERYTPSDGSCQSTWTGSAVTVGGGYIWEEVYAFAAKHERIAVGCDDKTIGSIGGYLQGGGHGAASHILGLATDQVLEYKVVFASGEVVTASACQHTDLFTVLRGGGGGTYGVVVSATIKAHHTHPVLAHTLQVVPLDDSLTQLLNTTAGIMSRYPILSDEGFVCYATVLRANGQALYEHTFIKMIESNSSSTIERAKHIMNQQVVDNLLRLNTTTFYVKSSFQHFPSFQEYPLGAGVTKHKPQTHQSWHRASSIRNHSSSNKRIYRACSRRSFLRKAQEYMPRHLSLSCVSSVAVKSYNPRRILPFTQRGGELISSRSKSTSGLRMRVPRESSRSRTRLLLRS